MPQPTTIAGLTVTIEEMHRAVAEEDTAGYSDLNRSLHLRLQRISRHETAADLVRQLRNRAVHHQYRLSMMPGRSAESLAQHAAIVDAVVAGDEAAAAMEATSTR